MLEAFLTMTHLRDLGLNVQFVSASKEKPADSTQLWPWQPQEASCDGVMQRELEDPSFVGTWGSVTGLPHLPVV